MLVGISNRQQDKEFLQSLQQNHTPEARIFHSRQKQDMKRIFQSAQHTSVTFGG